jgi:hypothetical protein
MAIVCKVVDSITTPATTPAKAGTSARQIPAITAVVTLKAPAAPGGKKSSEKGQKKEDLLAREDPLCVSGSDLATAL